MRAGPGGLPGADAEHEEDSPDFLDLSDLPKTPAAVLVMIVGSPYKPPIAPVMFGSCSPCAIKTFV